nr:pre-mRNA splicing Prp18-interacting factor [Tanacetum cinerariifolium]
MSSFVLCVGCGAQLYGFSPCQWCTCERCGNDLQNGFCSLCNSGNSYVYDPNPNSFDCPPDSYHPPHPTYETYSYDSYGNDSQFGIDCQPQFLLHYESEPGYNENYTSYPYDSSSVPQKYPCCARYGGPHETCQCDQLIFDEPYYKHCGGPHMNFQCQPMNQDSYNSNSLGFDQPKPHNELKCLSNLEYRDEIKIAELTENFNGTSIEIRKKEKLLQQEQWAYLSTHPSKHLHSFCFDDDDDEDYTSAITPDEPVLSTEETDNSLSIGDEHLDTIPATKSDQFIKSSVENLIPIPSESEGIPEHMCDVPFHDNSLPLYVSKDQFEDFSESNEEFSLTDDDSFSLDNIDYVEASPPDSELVSSEVMGIVIPEVGGIEASNDIPIPFYDPIIFGTPPNLTPSGESDFLLEIDAFLATKSSSTSPNSLLEETNNFDNSLTEFTTFSNVFCDAEYESDSSDDQLCSDEDVLEKIVSKPLESFSPSPILVKDSDSLIEEIDLFCTLDYPMPPGIVDKDYDSERDILIPKDFLAITPFHLLKKSNSILIFLRFLVLLQNHQMEKSPDLLSHRCGTVKKFNTHRSHLNKCPMMIHGQNNPPLDVLLFHFYPP